MKHISVKIEDPQGCDGKGYCKIFNDRSGDALTLSDSDASYWMSRMPELDLEPLDWAVTSPQPGHVINSNERISAVVSYTVGDTLILDTEDRKELMRVADIRTETTGVEPSEIYENGGMVPTWNLVGFDLVKCMCGALVPLGPDAHHGTYAICFLCSDEQQRD